MGLDMYLRKHQYVGFNFEHVRNEYAINKSHKIVIKPKKGSKRDPIVIDLDRVTTVIEEVAYWRKANAIHSWFVTNAQGGEDNCREHYVNKDLLDRLFMLCATILNGGVEPSPDMIADIYKMAYELQYTPFNESQHKQQYERWTSDTRLLRFCEHKLPPMAGFFFGDASYSEWYFDAIAETICQLYPLLWNIDTGKRKTNKEIGEDFYYQASW